MTERLCEIGETCQQTHKKHSPSLQRAESFRVGPGISQGQTQHPVRALDPQNGDATEMIESTRVTTGRTAGPLIVTPHSKEISLDARFMFEEPI